MRLCPECSYKLNYKHKKKEVTKKVKRSKNKKNKKRKSRDSDASSSDEEVKRQKLEEEKQEEEKKASQIWGVPVQLEHEKSREDDFAEYLEDLFL